MAKSTILAPPPPPYEPIKLKDALEDFYRSNDGNAVVMIGAVIRE